MKASTVPNEAAQTKVLILWADNTAANYGLRVLAKGNADLIANALRDQTVHVDWQDFGPGDSDVSFGTRSILKDLFRKKGPIKTKLRQYDLIVDSGAGDSFTDIYGFKRLSFIVYAHLLIHFMGIPLILAPQTIGPFNSRLGRLVAKTMLNRASLVISRDSASADYSRRLGRAADLTATDVVFALDAPSPANEMPHDIIINVSGLLWFSDDHLDSALYRREILALIEALTTHGRDVALLAHVIHSPSGNDDVDAGRDLQRSLERRGVTIPLLVPQSLSETREILHSAALVIGARMHACLNALSVGTPAIPWAYSRKFKPLFDDLGWNMTVDLRDTPSASETTLWMILTTDWDAATLQLDTIVGRATDKLARASVAIREAATRDSGSLAEVRRNTVPMTDRTTAKP